jgi:predicted DNA-binding transcriptional regulator AlpA
MRRLEMSLGGSGDERSVSAIRAMAPSVLPRWDVHASLGGDVLEPMGGPGSSRRSPVHGHVNHASERNSFGHPLLLSAQDLARLLNISVRSVWRRDSAGQIPRPVRIGRSVRWSRDEVAAWVRAGCPARVVWEGFSKSTRRS